MSKALVFAKSIVGILTLLTIVVGAITFTLGIIGKDDDKEGSSLVKVSPTNSPGSNSSATGSNMTSRVGGCKDPPSGAGEIAFLVILPLCMVGSCTAFVISCFMKFTKKFKIVDMVYHCLAGLSLDLVGSSMIMYAIGLNGCFCEGVSNKGPHKYLDKCEEEKHGKINFGIRIAAGSFAVLTAVLTFGTNHMLYKKPVETEKEPETVAKVDSKTSQEVVQEAPEEIPPPPSAEVV